MFPSSAGTQTVHSGKPELESVVPNSVPETLINVRDVRGSVCWQTALITQSARTLVSLIRMPGGCVEQNLASITLPLISTLYLDRSNSWESVGVQRKAEAIRYIRRGYENQLTYRRSDGSYPPYRGIGASTWITAYVVKVFSMAHSIIGINEQQVCDPLLYLVKNKFRHREKIYVEDNPVYSTTMTGGLCGDDPETTLTAFVHIGPTFVLIALKQAGIHCSSPGVNVEEAIRSTSAYLKRALTKPGRRPYTVAMASYALALDGLPTTLHELLLRAAAPDSPDMHHRACDTLTAWIEAMLLKDGGHVEQQQHQQQEQQAGRSTQQVRAHVIGFNDVSSESHVWLQSSGDSVYIGLLYLSDGQLHIPAVVTTAVWQRLQDQEDCECFAGLLNSIVCIQDYRLLFHVAPEETQCRFFLRVGQLAGRPRCRLRAVAWHTALLLQHFRLGKVKGGPRGLTPNPSVCVGWEEATERAAASSSTLTAAVDTKCLWSMHEP